MTENNKSCSTHGSIPVEFRQYVVIDRFISQLGFQLAGIHGGGGVGGGGGFWQRLSFHRQREEGQVLSDLKVEHGGGGGGVGGGGG